MKGVAETATNRVPAPASASDTASAAPAVSIAAISKRFGSVGAVTDCSLDVESGSFVSLLGPSGCGKTTLLRIIGGFETQDTGSVFIQGQGVDGLPPNKRDVNMVFQRYALFPHKTVAENIGFPLEVQGVESRMKRERVAEMIELVHLGGLEDRNATRLSGGQSQRVALARALVGKPKVLLLDEPLTALDLKLRKAMRLELRRIQEELETTFLYVTHDQEEALTMSERIVVMNEGRIVQQGDPEEIYDRPRSVFVSDFIGEANLLNGVVVSRDINSTTVDLGTTEIVAPPTQEVAVGDRVVVSVRPERISIGAATNADRAENRFQGQLERVIFLGSMIRSFAVISPGVVITSQAAADSGRHLVEGQTVTIEWRKADSVILAQDNGEPPLPG